MHVTDRTEDVLLLEYDRDGERARIGNRVVLLTMFLAYAGGCSPPSITAGGGYAGDVLTAGGGYAGCVFIRSRRSLCPGRE
jgi:hypothetical protein